MNRALEDFLYTLETMDTQDLASQALDDVWLAELTDEELIAVIHEMVKRLPTEEEEDWYEEEPDEYADDPEW